MSNSIFTLTAKKNKIIVSHFHDIIIGYLNQYNLAELDKSIDNPNEYNYYMDTGLTITIHIFKIALQLIKNINLATNYAEKGIMNYIEYITQLNKNGTLSISTLGEISICIYNKTIGELYNGNDTQTTTLHTPNHYLTINNNERNHVSPDNNEIDDCSILNHIHQLCNVLIWQSNTTFKIQQYMELIFIYFKKYCAIIDKIHIIPFTCYINTMQQKMGDTTTFTQYCEWLDELYTHIRKNSKKINNNNNYFNEKALDDYFIDK